MSDLARFLLDRISDEEEMARAAICQCGGPVCTVEKGWMHGGELLTRFDGNGSVASHIAAWSPARIVAECAAKRRIIELHRDDREHYCPTDAGSEYFNHNHGWADADESPQICPTLRVLAEPYRSHPSFDASWLLP